MNLQQQTRFKSLPWFKEDTNETIIIGGAGGIGSWLTIMLARAGFLCHVYDYDVIEEHNIGGQFFRLNDVDSTKVQALHTIVRDFTGEQVFTFNDKFTSESPYHMFMMSAFDNMEAKM